MEIIRCLKRFVTREIFGYLCCSFEPAQDALSGLDRYRSINAMVETFFKALKSEFV
jgi:hypothetical protein